MTKKVKRKGILKLSNHGVINFSYVSITVFVSLNYFVTTNLSERSATLFVFSFITFEVRGSICSFSVLVVFCSFFGDFEDDIKGVTKHRVSERCTELTRMWGLDFGVGDLILDQKSLHRITYFSVCHTFFVILGYCSSILANYLNLNIFCCTQVSDSVKGLSCSHSISGLLGKGNFELT